MSKHWIGEPIGAMQCVRCHSIYPNENGERCATCDCTGQPIPTRSLRIVILNDEDLTDMQAV